MLSKLQFYSRWFDTGFKHSYAVAEKIGGFIGFFWPAVVFIFGWGDEVNLIAWQIPLCILMTLVAFRVILAPYWMYKEDHELYAKESDAQLNKIATLTQRLSVSDKCLVIEHKNNGKQPFFQKNHDGTPSCRIIIHNLSNRPIRNVRVTIKAFHAMGSENFDTRQEICDRLRNLPLMRMGDPPTSPNQPEKSFTIPGEDSLAINVLQRTPSGRYWDIFHANGYSWKETPVDCHRVRIPPSKLEIGPYRIRLRVDGENDQGNSFYDSEWFAFGINDDGDVIFERTDDPKADSDIS